MNVYKSMRAARVSLVLISVVIFGLVVFVTFDKFQNYTIESVIKHTKDLVIPKRNLTWLPNLELFLYTALISNSSSDKIWDRLALQGWESTRLIQQNFVCCVKYKSGIVRQTPTPIRTKRDIFRVNLRSRQYICNVTKKYNASDPPVGATMAAKYWSYKAVCPTEASQYVNIEYVYKHPGEIAVFAKIVYSNISLPDFVAWLEIHRLLGMDKVLLYPFRLGQNASKLLLLYQEVGIVELVPMVFPNISYTKGSFDAMTKSRTYFNDEEVAILDSQERLRGYKYIVNFDIDEYIVPAKQETWMILFDRVFKQKPDAAGFTFGTYIFTTTWGPSSNKSALQIGRYFHRTRLTMDRVKHVVIPARIADGGVHTHRFTPKPAFKGYEIPEKEAVLRHYRPCRSSYHYTRTKCFQFKRYWDDTVYKRFGSLERDIKDLMKTL